VTPTTAGDRLAQIAGPRLEEIDAELAALNDLRVKPSGLIRLTATEYATQMILVPALAKLLPDYPDIQVEVVVDNGLTDIVSERIDAGVRAGEQVAKDMIAVRIGPDLRMAAVASPAYFAAHSKPRTPQDLTDHNCINLRLATYGGLYAWEFERGRREVRVKVEGQLVFNSPEPILKSALAGLGLAYLEEGLVAPHLESGALERVLADWSPPYPGFHLYYPSRRQPTAAFILLVEALRWRG
jgi:DNA-binding transcriptional LysR family regulator